MEPRPSIGKGLRPFLDRLNESRQLGAKWFFRWKLELVHRALLRFYRVAIDNVPVFKRLDFVLRHVVITHSGRIRSHNRYFAEFARGMVSGFYRGEYR